MMEYIERKKIDVDIPFRLGFFKIFLKMNCLFFK